VRKKNAPGCSCCGGTCAGIAEYVDGVATGGLLNVTRVDATLANFPGDLELWCEQRVGLSGTAYAAGRLKFKSGTDSRIGDSLGDFSQINGDYAATLIAEEFLAPNYIGQTMLYTTCQYRADGIDPLDNLNVFWSQMFSQLTTVPNAVGYGGYRTIWAFDTLADMQTYNPDFATVCPIPSPVWTTTNKRFRVFVIMDLTMGRQMVREFATDQTDRRFHSFHVVAAEAVYRLEYDWSTGQSYWVIGSYSPRFYLPLIKPADTDLNTGGTSALQMVLKAPIQSPGNTETRLAQWRETILGDETCDGYSDGATVGVGSSATSTVE
jgi:hypothetical protein